MAPEQEADEALRLLSEAEFLRMVDAEIAIESARESPAGTQFVFTVDGVLAGEPVRGARYVGRPGQSFADCLPMLDKSTAEWMLEIATDKDAGYMEFSLNDLQTQEWRFKQRKLPENGQSDPGAGAH